MQKNNNELILVTTDGVKIYDKRQKIFSVSVGREWRTNDNFSAGDLHQINQHVTVNWFHFSTKKAREEYINN